MELRDQLLNNEIQQLGQIIQKLSCELVIMQDFLKDHFGSNFENYRRKYTESDDLSSSSKKPTKKQPYISEDSDDNVEDRIVKAELVDGINYDDPYSDSEEDTTNVIDPLSSTSAGQITGKSGRRKKKIWMFFDRIPLGNNKVSARCHICKCKVSSRAQRMVEHRMKCKLSRQPSGVINAFKKSKPSDKTLNKEHESFSIPNEETTEDLPAVFKDSKIQYVGPEHIEKSFVADGLSAMEADNETPTVIASHNTHQSNAHSDSQTRSLKTSESQQNAKLGKPLDEVWKYYEVVKYKGFRKARCLTCGHHVSPKADRMRQHKVVCGEVA